MRVQVECPRAVIRLHELHMHHWTVLGARFLTKHDVEESEAMTRSREICLKLGVRNQVRPRDNTVVDREIVLAGQDCAVLVLLEPGDIFLPKRFEFSHRIG